MNGIINFLKPPGMSSNGAVVFLRGLFGVRKTGHAGTLDPGACGVLPICVGKATKISSYLMGGEKEYIAEITFGKSTDTADSYGLIKDVSTVIPKQSDIQNVLPRFEGMITQQTPAYSAVKHEGKKLYQLARKGQDIPCKVRDVVIHKIEYQGQTREDAHLIRVVCGKGTYIRTLCEDIAKSLGTVAYMSFLSRTKCAGLDSGKAYTADELKALDNKRHAVLLPIDMFLGDLQKIVTITKDRYSLFNGGIVSIDEADTKQVCVYVDNQLLGIGQVENKQLKITTRLVDE